MECGNLENDKQEMERVGDFNTHIAHWRQEKQGKSASKLLNECV